MEISLAYSAHIEEEREGEGEKGLAESARNSSINLAERKLVKTNLPGIESIVLHCSTAANGENGG